MTFPGNKKGLKFCLFLRSCDFVVDEIRLVGHGKAVEGILSHDIVSSHLSSAGGNILKRNCCFGDESFPSAWGVVARVWRRVFLGGHG